MNNRVNINEKQYYFQEDYEGLTLKIRELECEYEKMGQASTEGSDIGDWHDNFTYEECERQLKILSTRISNMKQLLSNAVVLRLNDYTPDPSKISLGSKVKILTSEGEIKKYFIGSYQLFRKETFIDDYYIVSYNSPFAKKIIGHCKGEKLIIDFGSKSNYIKIIEIE